MQSLRYRRLDTLASRFIPASCIFSLFALHLSSHPACGSTKVPAFTETAKTTFLPPAEDKESFKTGPQLRYGAARGYFAQVQEAFVYRPGLQSYQYSGSQFERSEPVSTRQYWCTVLAGQVSAACPAGIGHAAKHLLAVKCLQRNGRAGDPAADVGNQLVARVLAASSIVFAISLARVIKRA